MIPWCYSIDPAEAYPQVEKMIQKHAWNFSKKTGLDFEEALSEAYCQFLTACSKFDPSRGVKFSSYCYMIVQMRLVNVSKSFIERIARTKVGIPHLEILPSIDPPRISALEIFEDLSQDAQQIVTLILESPQDLVWVGEQARTPKQFLRQVSEYLVERREFTEERVKGALRELTAKLRKVWSDQW